jgi:hypothetical protein
LTQIDRKSPPWAPPVSGAASEDDAKYRTSQAEWMELKRVREASSATKELLDERAIWKEKMEEMDEVLAVVAKKRLQKIDALLLKLAEED